MPCDEPCTQPSRHAIAVTSTSRIPGLISAITLRKIASCIAAQRRINSSSSALLIAINRSICPVMSITVSPSKPSTMVCTSWCGMVPGTTKPMVL